MISYANASDVKEVAETLKNVDINALLAKINLKEFASSGTYSDFFWEREQI
ncbi:YfbM family protein [Campylobacter concisus]|nr:YfbM family protein [Campylobacter concisus]